LREQKFLPADVISVIQRIELKVLKMHKVIF